MGILVALLASCSAAPRVGPIPVSVIGDGFGASQPASGTLSAPDAVLAQATRPGLVRFDAAGQVAPALAESWITTSDGLSTIFRLRDPVAGRDTALTSRDIARQLSSAIAPRSRNPLKPLLSAVESVVGMTERVVELRLKVPRPNLLQLLAQPELGIAKDGATGQWRVERVDRRRMRLHPIETVTGSTAAQGVTLTAERAARAIVGFQAGATDLVLGGTIADWPLVRLVRTRPGRLRVDPARGLLGVSIVGRNAFLSDAGNRQAMAMAIDRPALAAMVALPGWQPREQLLPDQLDSAASPTLPPWTTIAPAERKAEAARRIAAWVRANGPPPTLRIALPDGPGWRLVFARLAADWRAIGVRVEASARDADADLRTIDAVAPNASANWFLSVTGCDAGLICDQAGDAELQASRAEPTLTGRARRIARSDAASAGRGSFIVLGAPIRWALVDPSLTLFRENAMAAHPLDQLRPPR